tara:strand:+ start:6613 stop:7068 length:456 start_codon:yes stop_codon:yes gene_type:complete
MSLIKNLLLIIILNIFIVTTSYAQTTTSTTGQFTFLNKGDAAPFEGTLFDPVAISKILAQKEIDEKRCAAQLKYETSLLSVKCKRDSDLLQTELEIEKRKHNLIVAAQKDEIETLRDLAKGNDTTLWTAVGFAVGALTSIAIFYVSVEIVK